MAAPVTTGPVFSGAQEVLAPPVVRMLVEDPVTLQNVAGVNVTVAEAVVEIGAVVHYLHRMSCQVRSVVDPHSVGPSVLFAEAIGTWLLSKFGSVWTLESTFVEQSAFYFGFKQALGFFKHPATNENEPQLPGHDRITFFLNSLNCQKHSVWLSEWKVLGGGHIIFLLKADCFSLWAWQETFMLWPASVCVNGIKRAVIDIHFKSWFDVQGEWWGGDGRGWGWGDYQFDWLTGGNIWQERMQLLKPIQQW